MLFLNRCAGTGHRACRQGVACALQSHHRENTFPGSPCVLSPSPFSCPEPALVRHGGAAHQLEGITEKTGSCILRWPLDSNFSLHIFYIMSFPLLLRSSSERQINCCEVSEHSGNTSLTANLYYKKRIQGREEHVPDNTSGNNCSRPASKIGAHISPTLAEICVFVLSRLFVQSLNILRHEMLEGTKLLKDLNKRARLETSCVTSLSTRFVAFQFLLGARSLVISPFFWALLTPPRPALLSGRLRALRSVVTTHSPPLSPCLHFHTASFCGGGAPCTQGVEVAQESS